MILYFVRHGQTNLNHKKLIQGRVDAPLNNTGKKQAKNAGQVLKALDITFDKVVSSPLSRALETASLVARKLNYKDNILLNENLIERDFGNHEMQPIAESFPIIMAENFEEEFYESDKEIVNRVQLGVNQLYSDYAGKKLVVAAHAHVIRCLYILIDSKKYNFTNFFLGNGSIHVFKYDGTNMTLQETFLNEEE